MPDRRHERDIKTARPLVHVLLLTVLVMAMASLALWGGYQLLREPDPGTGPQAWIELPPGKAELQRHPQQDLAELRARMQQRLGSVGWVDREAGIVHMPIERAMTLLVQRGLTQDQGGTGGEASQ